jgi:hypothetical protein
MRPGHSTTAWLFTQRGRGWPAYAASLGDGTSERRHPLGLCDVVCAPLPPLWVCGSVGPCMWACIAWERERETWAVWCEEGGSSSLRYSSKAEVTCMARLVACRDAMAAGRGSGRVVGVRALWTRVRHTDDSIVRIARLCPAVCVCILASSGERDTSDCGVREESTRRLPDAPCLTLERRHC